MFVQDANMFYSLFVGGLYYFPRQFAPYITVMFLEFGAPNTAMASPSNGEQVSGV